MTTARRQRDALDRAIEQQCRVAVERAARERRVDLATARVLLALDRLHDARRETERTYAAIGEALIQLLASGVSIQRAAQLCKLSAAELRRLRCLTQMSPTDTATDARARDDEAESLLRTHGRKQPRRVSRPTHAATGRPASAPERDVQQGATDA
jgi:hypothetical protein